MNHNTLFGIAAIITSIGFLIQSIPTAGAYGPTISMGSNTNFAVYYSSYQSGTVFTNNTSMTAIITDISVTSSTYGCTRRLSISNSTDEFSLTNVGSDSKLVSLTSGIKVPAGESLLTTGGTYCQDLSLSGYYAHP